MDRDNKPVTQFRERVTELAANLDRSNSPIGVPTPAMAEILVRAGKGRSQYIAILQDTWRFQILPFDSRAAIEAADLIEKTKSSGDKWETWAKVKFDIQIVSIAKAESATLIYSDDKDVENFAKRVNIRVFRICDLPLPTPEETPIQTGSVGSQGTLPLVEAKPEQPIIAESQPTSEVKADAAKTTAAEKDNKLQADPAHPASVQGSDSGRAQGEAAGETRASEKSPKTAGS
jgi:predicted nucleic acid-binding protein